MDLYIIKKMVLSFKINKKGYVVYESLVIPLSLLIAGLMIFFSFSLASAQEETFENLAPEISYHFPKTVVYSFLMMPLNDSDKMTFFQNKDKNYLVRDLIFLDTDESLATVEGYRELYLEDDDLDMVNQFDKFYTFSKDSSARNAKKIIIQRDRDSLPDIKKVSEEKNAYFYVITADGSYTLIFFKLYDGTYEYYGVDPNNSDVEFRDLDEPVVDGTTDDEGEALPGLDGTENDE